jgi:hypothetical protein
MLCFKGWEGVIPARDYAYTLYKDMYVGQEIILSFPLLSL